MTRIGWTRSSLRDRGVLALFYLLSLVDAVVYLGSLSLVTSDLRTLPLFDWFPD